MLSDSLCNLFSVCLSVCLWKIKHWLFLDLMQNVVRGGGEKAWVWDVARCWQWYLCFACVWFEGNISMLINLNL